jgi:hypothetical protein
MVAMWVPLVTARVPLVVPLWVHVALVTPEVNATSRKSSLSRACFWSAGVYCML